MVTDALGRRTDFTYEANGNVLTVTRLAGTADAVTTTFTYHASFSQVASVTDSLSHTTAFGYDGTSNLTSVTDREPRDHGDLQCRRPAAHGHTPGGTTTLSYDFGDRVLVADPLGLTTSRFVENAGRVVSVTDPRVADPPELRRRQSPDPDHGRPRRHHPVDVRRQRQCAVTDRRAEQCDRVLQRTAKGRSG